MADGSPSCADCTQLKISRRAFNCRKDIFLFHRPINQTVEERVVAFSYNRVNRSQFDAVFLAQLHHIFHQCVMYFADIQRSGQSNRRFQRPQLIQLYQSECFSKTIDYLSSGGHLMHKRVFDRRQDHRHPCLIITVCNRPVSDPNTGYVGNQVALSTRQRTNRKPKGRSPYSTNICHIHSSYHIKRRPSLSGESRLALFYTVDGIIPGKHR